MGTQPIPKEGAELHPQFSVHFYCSQMAGCIRMPLGMEVCISPGDFVFDGDQPPPQKGAEPLPIFAPCLLQPNGCIDQDATWYKSRHRPRRHCVRCGPSSPPQKGGGPPPQFSAHVYCGQTAGWIKVALGLEVGLCPGYIALYWDPAPLLKKGAEPSPNCRPISIVAKRLDASRCHSVRR